VHEESELNESRPVAMTGLFLFSEIHLANHEVEINTRYNVKE
jgi:hypothetical protein